MNSPSPGSEFRNILVCVAEGATSDHAVRAAANLAQRLDASMELLHVVPPILIGPTTFAGLSSETLSRQRAEQAHRAIAAHLAHRHSDVTYRGRALHELLTVSVGTPARVVLDHVREKQTDLLVVGDSGKRKQLDMGGLARALYSRAECPMWTQTEPPRNVERILVPIDLSESSRVVLAHGVRLAKNLGARVHALECFVRPELFYGAGMEVPAGPLPYTIDSLRNVEYQAFGRFLEEFDWLGVDHTAEFVDDDPARAILASQERYDLIVMGTHGRSALAAALLGSVTWQVLRLARTPVLTIRDVQGRFAM